MSHMEFGSSLRADKSAILLLNGADCQNSDC